ncbi:MAG: DUF4884 domain-containing protein [Spirosomataceae bacterium]
MKKINVLFMGFLLAVGLSSCLAPAQKVLQASNPQVRVELLFEVDGCKVYRFNDGSGFKYFTKCEFNSSVGWVDSCGKNCTYYTENMTTYTGVRPIVKK